MHLFKIWRRENIVRYIYGGIVLISNAPNNLPKTNLRSTSISLIVSVHELAEEMIRNDIVGWPNDSYQGNGFVIESGDFLLEP